MAKEPKKNSTAPTSSPRPSQEAKSPQDSPKKGKKKGKGKKGGKNSKKQNLNKKVTLLFFVNGRADTEPFKESKVQKNTINNIMQTNLHGEWEYQSKFICNLDGSLLKDPHEKITKSMAFVMVPRSENFKPAYYKRKFIDYMTELKESKRTSCWC